MIRSSMAQAALIGCLAALTAFCALQAGAEETYSIVAQSTASSAATGRRPLAERIAAANQPIITRADSVMPANPVRAAVGRQDASRGQNAGRPQETARTKDTARTQEMTRAKEQAAGAQQPGAENMAVAAVDVVRAEAGAAAAQPAPAAPKPRLPTPPVRWPFTTRQPAAIAQQEAATSRKGPGATPQPAAAKERQSTARSSGKGLSNSSPASVTR